MADPSLQLLTVTWSADQPHFELLRDSLARSPLAECPHRVVVQDEDLSRFAGHRETVTLRSSAEVLPETVERRRRRARRWQQWLGRRGTTVAGSLARRLGRPAWVRYTGWHTQQLCKLAVAAASEADTVVVLDSDVVVSPHAGAADFVHPGGAVVCYQHWLDSSQVSRKVRHWQETVHRLLDRPLPADGYFDCYFDTPFVFHAPAVRQMLAWLEDRHRQPWWQVLLAQPPRQWSEFGLYRAFLRHHYDGPVDWRNSDHIGYLYDASDPRRLAAEFRRLVAEQGRHYITIHSQSSGRHGWHPDDYAPLIRQVLAEMAGDG